MSGDREAYQAAMREAHALAWSLKWEGASQKYREALAEFPSDPTARLSLAVALTRVGEFEGALKEYLGARELLPNDTLVLARIGDLCARIGKSTDAASAFVSQARLFIAVNDVDKALASLRRAAEVAGRDPRSLMIVAEAARGLDTPAVRVLLADLEALLAQAPVSDADHPVDSVPAPAADEAVADQTSLSASLDSDAEPASRVSEDPSQLLSAAEFSKNTGRTVQAILYYLQAADLLEDVDAVQNALRSAGEIAKDFLPGDVSEVRELPPARRAAVLEAIDAGARYLRDGATVAAVDEVYRAVGCAPSFLPSQILFADIERRIGRVGEAIERIGRVASLYELRGEQPRAVAALRLQVEMDADPGAARRRLVDFMVTTGQAEKAAGELVDWAGEALAAGDPATAATRLRESTQLLPRLESLRLLGETEEVLGNLGVARAAFERALEIEFDVSALGGAARCAAALGDWSAMENGIEVVGGRLRTDVSPRDEVLNAYRAAIDIHGRRPGMVYCLGILLIATGEEAEGERLLREVADRQSRPGRLACYHLGERDAIAGRVSEATRWFWMIGEPATAETEADRDLAIAGHRRLVDLCGRAGDWDGAARGIEGLLRVYPEEDTLHTRLAEVFFRLRKVSEAVTVLGELATVYASRGDIERAIGVERGRAQIAPLDGSIRARLGRMLLDANLIEEGLAELDAAAKLISADGRAAEAADLIRLMLDISRQRDPARALALRETLTQLTPDDVEARFDLIDAYIKLGRSIRAESEAQQLVDYLLREYRLSEAARALRVVIQLAPWNIDDRVRLGHVLGQIGEIGEALTILRGVLDRDPANRDASNKLASLLAEAAARSASETKDARGTAD